MKFVPNAVTRTVATQVLKTQKHAPSILFVGGVAGVVVSTVLACKATLKLETVLEEAEYKAGLAKELKHSEYSEEDRKKDLLLIYVQTATEITKLYGPALIVGVASIAALTKSHQILSRRNVALTAAYAGMEKAFKEYRGRVVAEVGEERESDIYNSVETRDIISDKGKVEKLKVKTTGSPYAVMFDEYNKNWQTTPEYNAFFLRARQNIANDQLRSRGHLLLNEVLRGLGLPETSAGCVVGWVWNNGDNYVDFGMGDWPSAGDYVHGTEGAILLDFNVDGVVYDLIDQRN